MEYQLRFISSYIYFLKRLVVRLSSGQYIYIYIYIYIGVDVVSLGDPDGSSHLHDLVDVTLECRLSFLAHFRHDLIK